MPRWIQRPDTGELIPAEKYERPAQAGFFVHADLPEYRSPVTGEVVRGRRQRREDLKRHGCVEWLPSDKPKFMQEHS